MSEHQWSGWPGAFCLQCRIGDPREECLANNPDCQCGLGPDEEGNPVGGPCIVEMPPCPGKMVTIPKKDYDLFQEFQEVAALLAEDIEFAWELALDKLGLDPDEGEEVNKLLKELEEEEETEDSFRWFLWVLKDLKEKRDIAVTQPEKRQKRFRAMQMLFSLPFAPQEDKGEAE